MAEPKTERLSISRRAAEKLSWPAQPSIFGGTPFIVGKYFRLRGGWVLVVSQSGRYRHETENPRSRQLVDIDVREPAMEYEKAAANAAFREGERRLIRQGASAKNVLALLGTAPYPELEQEIAAGRIR